MSAFADEARRALAMFTGEARSGFQATHRHAPGRFVRECFTWPARDGPTDYQIGAVDQLEGCRRLALRSLHGAGKTTIAAWLVLWFALTRDGDDWKVITTAGAWRQLTVYLWPEIHKWARRLRWDVVGRRPFRKDELLAFGLKLDTGEAMAVASHDPALIEGAHADHLLYVLDEAKTIPGATFDAVEGAFSGGGEDTGREALAFAVSTPGPCDGRFYEIHARKAGLTDWHVEHVTLEKAIAAGRVSQAWADARKLQWGEESAPYQTRVLGNFATAESEGFIPLSWVEAANLRWLERQDAGTIPTHAQAIGVDVARSGDDKSVFAPSADDCIMRLVKHGKIDTMTCTGYVRQLQQAIGGTAIVDVNGIGAGVVDRLRELQADVKAFNSAWKTDATDRSGELTFTNLRAAAYWTVRDELDPAFGATLALPPDDDLTGDLTAHRSKMVSGGRIQIESKEDLKRRIGRSPDASDSVVMVRARHLLPSNEEPTLSIGASILSSGATSRWRPQG